MGGFEISGTYGWMWGGSIDYGYLGNSGTLRLASGQSYFFGLGLPVRPGTRVTLSYTRQNSAINLDDINGLQELTGMSVDYWQIGGIQEMPQGNVVPFGGLTLGATHFSPDQDTVEIDGDDVNVQSATKFSFAMNLGTKVFLGETQRIALRGQLRLFSTLYNTGGGLWFGSGGGGVTVTGNAIWTWEIAGGVTIRLG